MFIFFLVNVVFALQPHLEEKLKLDKLTRDIMSNHKSMRFILEMRTPCDRGKYDNKRVCDRMVDIIAKEIKNDYDPQQYGTPRQLALFIIAYHVDYNTDKVIIKTLIDNVHIRFPPFETLRLSPPDEKYPALRGLLLIGEKAASPILEKIKGTDNHSIHDLLAYWFSKYYGRKMSLLYLGNLMEEDRNMTPEQRSRLVYVIERITSSKN